MNAHLQIAVDVAVLVQVRERAAHRLHDGGDAVLVQPLYGNGSVLGTATRPAACAVMQCAARPARFTPQSLHRLASVLGVVAHMLPCTPDRPTLGLVRRMMSDAEPPAT